MKSKTKNILLLTSIIGIILMCSSCRKGIEGEGPVTINTLALPALSGVDNKISADIYLTQSNVQEVKVEGEANVIQHITTGVHNGIWNVEFDECVYNHRKITIYISMKSITRLDISGSGNIYTQGIFDSCGIVDLGISGSGSIDAGIHCSSLTSGINGSGNIRLSGSTPQHTLTIRGSGDINAFGFQTGSTRIDVYGSGSCKVNAVDELSVNIWGSGDVYYIGYPAISFSNNGSGKIINSN